MSKRIIGKVKISADTARIVVNSELENFKNFDSERILSRAYFQHLEMPENMTDKEILDALPVGTVEESEKSVMKLRKILSAVESYTAFLEQKREENQREFEKTSAEFVNSQLADERRETREIEEKIQSLKQSEKTIENFIRATNLVISGLKIRLEKIDSDISEHYRKTFASRLKSARKKAGMTQQQLADSAGLSRVGLTQYESANREPSVTVANRLARSLNVSLDWLAN